MTIDTTPAAGIHPSLAVFARFGTWLTAIPYWLLIALLVTATTLHAGFRVVWHPDLPYEMAAANWPSTNDTWASSIGWLVIPSRLGLVGSPLWDWLWVGLLVLTVVVVAVCARRLLPEPTARLFVVVIAASAIPVQLLWSLGRYDELLLVGVLLLAVLGQRTWWIGALLIGLANPEMGIAAGIAGLLVGIGLRSRVVLVRSGGAVAASIIAGIVVVVARHLDGGADTGSRASALGKNLAWSVGINLQWLPMTLSTMYLTAWLVVIVAVFRPRRAAARWWLAAGLVGVPMILTIITLDGTRVAVGTSSVAFVLLLREWLVDTADGKAGFQLKDVPTIIGVLAATALLVPAASVFVYDPAAAFLPPWEVLFVYARSVIPFPIG